MKMRRMTEVLPCCRHSLKCFCQHSVASNASDSEIQLRRISIVIDD
jgi:hypothetical protein